MLILYTSETDSAILKILTPDIYEFIRRECNNFDSSDYPLKDRYNIPQKNKKSPGIKKDKCNGQIMKEFIVLRSEVYSFLVEDKTCDNNIKLHKKGKGVEKSSMKKNVSKIILKYQKKKIFSL